MIPIKVVTGDTKKTEPRSPATTALQYLQPGALNLSALPPLSLTFAFVFPDRADPWADTSLRRFVLSLCYAPAFALGEKSGDPVEMYLNDIFTVTVNMAGLPGMSVPAGLWSEGTPLGLQLIGKPFDEETLFRVGRAIEVAAGPLAKPQDWWSRAA